MTVLYLIVILFFVLANGEQYHNIQQERTSQPSDQRLSGKKEYLLYLTPEQVQALQTEGAVVRPVSHEANAFLQQQYQQSVEDNIKPQAQIVPSNEEHKPDKGLEDIYKMLNNLQANDGVVFQTQSIAKPVEKSRGKDKFKSKLRQKEHAYESFEYEKNVQRRPKNKNKSNIRSTGYTHYPSYAPRYGAPTLKAKLSGDQTLPHDYYQNTEESLGYSSYLHIRGENNSNPTEIPKLENVPKSTKFQNPEEIQEHVAVQRREEVQRSAERQRYENVPLPVEIEDTGFPLHLRFGSEENSSSPTEVPKFGEVSKPTGFQRPKKIPVIQKHEEIQRAAQRQRYEEFQTPVEYEDLEPALYLPSGAENNSNSKEIPKLGEISKPTGFQRPKDIPVIQKHEDIQRAAQRQRYEEFQTPVEYEDLEPALYLPNEAENNSNTKAIPKLEEISKPIGFRRPEEVQKSVVIQRHGDTQISVQGQRYEKFQTPVEYEDLETPLYLPVGAENNSSPKEIPKFEEVSKPTRVQSPEDIQEPVVIQRHEDIQRTAQRERYKKLRIPIQVQDQEETKEPIEIQQQDHYRRPLEIRRQIEVSNDIKKPEIIDPIIQAPTYTIAIRRMSTKQPISVVQSSTENTGFVTFDEKVSDLVNRNQSALEDVETQSIVAEGLALQNFAKKRQGLIKEELTFKSLRRENKIRAPKLSLSTTPRSYPVSWVTPTSISNLVPQPEKSLQKQDVPKVEKTINIPGIRNAYSKLNTPYLLKKTVPGNINQKTPLYASGLNPLDLDQSENYVILRPIWEH